MTIERRQWNYAAITALLVLIVINGVAAVAFFTSKITWQDWLSATGLMNGTTLGWVTRAMGQPQT